MTEAALHGVYSTLTSAWASGDGAEVQRALNTIIGPQARINMCYPFAPLNGGDDYWQQCFAPLFKAVPDVERREMIALTGTTPEGQHWIGSMGNYMGTFITPFLDIPPTGHLVHMRYHEYFRVEGDRIVEAQAIWDIPELMMQADAWPMAPQLGTALCTPAPMTQDGLFPTGDGTKAYEHVSAMLTDLCRYPAEGGPEVMNLDAYWHPKFNWYGPAGIGAMRGIAGFRHWHQMPFLRAMPDRKLDATAALHSHWFASGDYVCETGWPNMRLTLSGDGWMGIAPSGREVLLRSLDFWRLEGNKIRENWVLVDLLDLYAQIGVNVLARMREFNKAHYPQSLAQSALQSNAVGQ